MLLLNKVGAVIEASSNSRNASNTAHLVVGRILAQLAADGAFADLVFVGDGCRLMVCR